MADSNGPGAGRGSGRRKSLAIGAAGLTAVIGGGAYALGRGGGTGTADVAAIASAPSASAASDAVSPSSSMSGAPAPSVAPSVAPEVRKKIQEARDKMKKDGVPIMRAPVQPATKAAVEEMRTTRGSLKEGGIVRVVSARSDLTGQGELAWVAGGVSKYRDVECSQTFRFSTNPTPSKRANLLLCWRTSPTKSVVAVVVDPKGKPSKAKAWTELQRRWISMK